MRSLAFAALFTMIVTVAALSEYAKFKQAEFHSAENVFSDSVELPYDIDSIVSVIKRTFNDIIHVDPGSGINTLVRLLEVIPTFWIGEKFDPLGYVGPGYHHDIREVPTRFIASVDSGVHTARDGTASAFRINWPQYSSNQSVAAVTFNFDPRPRCFRNSPQSGWISGDSELRCHFP
jgi:hypothetical protein